MWFVGLGVLLGLLKLLDIGPPSVWSWWVVLSPFVLALVWWTWADKSGYTKRKQMDKMEERKHARRNQNLSALGIDPRAYDKKRRVGGGQSLKGITKVEQQRAAQQKKNHDSVINSRMDGQNTQR